MSKQFITWQWQANHNQSYHICAAVAWHSVRLPLLQYLINEVAHQDYNELQIISHRDVLVLIGKPQALPWINGIEYAGYIDGTPNLWLPSHSVPSVPIPLLADALCQQYKQNSLLVWHSPKVVIPLSKALIVSHNLLTAIIGDKL